MKNILYNILKWIYIPLTIIWQILQNLIGLFCLLWFCIIGKIKFISCRTFPDKSGKNFFFYDNLYILNFYASEMSGAITLGQIVILSNYNKDKEDTVKHEGGGHTKQSLILGPLYIFVIGIPSLLHAAFHNCRKYGLSYMHFFSEKWAQIKAGLLKK